MDKKLLEILACPLCKSNVNYNKEHGELICRSCYLAYPVCDGIPMMLEGQARILTAEERLDKSL